MSKTIHREASLLLYARNCFDFSMGTSEDVASFLEQIGRNNAGCIRHICVSFPNFFSLDPGAVTLEQDSASILATIQSHCTNLKTLTASVYTTNVMELKLDALDNLKITGEALSLVNTHFRTIPSLQEIIVEVYADGPCDHARRLMESHGWTVRIVEYVESDWERDSNDFDCDYDRYDNDDYSDHDSYDIDNDSDFWRRAAD